MISELNTIIEKMLHKRLRNLELGEQLKNPNSMEVIDSPSQKQCAGLSYARFTAFQKPKPAFEPPYDSPIENDFAYNIVKYLDERVAFKKQVSVKTICGRFRLDFIAYQSGRCIGFECDGKEFHNNEVHCSGRDRWRDALILETGIVEVIYRFPGKNLVYNINDCLFILAVYEPQLFSERSLENLKALASVDVKNQISEMQQYDEKEWIFCGYEEFRYQYGISIYRHHRNNFFLLEMSTYAKKYGEGDLDRVMQQFDIERSTKNLVF